MKFKEEDIGNWRLTKKSINYLSDKYIFRYNDLIEIPKIENAKQQKIDMVDEWDPKAICK